jgi:tRNA-dihydrouridine synthase
MVGRGAMGNPWLFRSLAALSRGEADPGPPTLEERHTVWRRHAALVWEYSVERMRVHELHKTLAWYSRGLRGGAELRQQAGQRKDARWLMELGERFFERLRAEGDHGGSLTTPADPVAKSLARQGRKQGAASEAPEPCAA